MTDKPNNIARELHEAEALEGVLTRVLSTIQPPAGAKDRLLAKLSDLMFHESQLTLDAVDPYNFEQALKAQEATEQYDGTDLLAAGLEAESEEPPIDESELDPDDEE